MKEKICITKRKISGNMIGMDCFLPVYMHDIRFMEKCNANKPFLISIRKARNYRHHKLVFAVARCVLASLPHGHYLSFLTPYDLIKAIMIDAGIVDWKINIDGTMRMEAKSLNFESMSQAEFEPVSKAIFKIGAAILKIEVHELEKNYLEYL